MKLLPQKYRELQSDWFTKRGILWHISVVARKIQGHFYHQALVNIVENYKKDSFTVVRILEHTLSTLKKEHQQDNAGCYHCTGMLANCAQMNAKTGIAVTRVDFSDPQGGKGSCDLVKSSNSQRAC